MLIIRAKYHSLLTICAATTVFISADSFSTPLPKLQVLHAFNEQNNNTLASIPRSLTQGKDGSLFGVIRGSDSGPSSKVFKINLNQNPPKYTDYFNFAAFDDFNNLDNEFVAATHLTLARNGSIYVSGLGRGFVAGPESLYKITSLNPAQSSIISSFPT